MSERKTLKETLSKQDALAFVEGKMPENGSTVEKKGTSMKDIKSKLATTSDIKYTRITADLPPKIHRRLKGAVADMGTDINKLVNALIVNFLDENEY
jgi:hypothetical protein